MCSGDDCDELDRRLQTLEDARDRDALGWIGIGVGAAGLVTGAVLYSISDDPHRYDAELEDDLLASLNLELAFGALRLSGQF